MEPKVNVSLSLGGLFQGFFDGVNDTIKKASVEMKSAVVEAEIEAGQQIQLAIANAQRAYESELNKTVDKINTEAKKTFDSIKSWVDAFQERNLEALDDLTAKVQAMILALPFSDKHPRLLSVKPREIVISDIAKSSFVTFEGIFPWSDDPKHPATLSFGDKICSVYDSNTRRLTFQVPHSVFDQKTPNQYSYSTGKLVVPYNNGWVFNNWVDSEYKVGLGSLPMIAGAITVEYTSNQTKRVTTHKTSDEVFLNGNTWYPEHWHTETTHFYPTVGWLIDVSKKAHLTAIHDHGDHKQSITSETANEVVVTTQLYCKDGESIGKVKIKVDFDQYQDQQFLNKRTEKFDVNWKDSKVLEPLENETISKLTFVSYDGSTQEFAGPDISGILKVTTEINGKWKIWAEPPKELKNKFDQHPQSMKDQHTQLPYAVNKENAERIKQENKDALQQYVDEQKKLAAVKTLEVKPAT